MCLIILSPSGRIPKKHLAAALEVNPHGWGYSIAAGGELTTRRGMTPAEFWSAWRADKYIRTGATALFHARYATHGTMGVENCHPFDVGGGWTMAHNGCISGLGGMDQSDTSELAEIIRACGQLYISAHGMRLLALAIGKGSKLVFLAPTGEYLFANESYGHWHKGNWYSNTGYLISSILRCPMAIPARSEPRPCEGANLNPEIAMTNEIGPAKLAVIRDEFKTGVRFELHANCPCGSVIPIRTTQRMIHRCESCGLAVDSRGWIRRV
jgi:glutamine amidotransferase